MGIEKKIRLQDLLALKVKKEPITMLTAYDYSMARLLDSAGVEVILVGDSLANVIMGLGTTLPVPMAAMLHHARAVARGCARALLIVDMPFGSYQASVEKAVGAATRIMKADERIEGVKLEGGLEIVPQIKGIVAAGIPVMGHIGLRPQSVHALSGYGVQGSQPQDNKDLQTAAIALQEAGCFAIVLEKIPAKLAAKITQKLNIPTIGIGAGADVDGQVLVLYDMLGLNTQFAPRFLRRYEDMEKRITNATRQYIQDVKKRTFPNENEHY